MDRPLTLCDLLELAVTIHHNPRMLNFKAGGEWKAFTSDRVYENVKAISLGLRSLGVNPGDHVALYADSSPFWTMSDFGIIHTGAADVPFMLPRLFRR